MAGPARTAAWEEDALCAQVGPFFFFPDKEDQTSSTAREICRRCPVKAPCLKLALDMERGDSRKLRFGVWGGTVPKEREAMDRTVTIDASDSGDGAAA